MDRAVNNFGGDDGPRSGQNISTSDGGEQDEPSSSNQKPDVENLLASFRENWQKELAVSPKRQHSVNRNTVENQDDDDDDDYENNARRLFLKGVEMEKTGKLYEAIQFYRRAVQIVPDIEFRLDKISNPVPRENQIEEENECEDVEDREESETDSDDAEEIKNGQLLTRIRKKFGYPHFVIAYRNYVLYIEMGCIHRFGPPVLRGVFCCLSGFYLCARDPEIWRLACIRVWGLNCGPTPGNYETWRNMYIERPSLHFNGCYISKTTYIRNGENSFQDQFYRPWHLIAYYRFLRFFPEGTCLMLTSSEEPAQCVGLMKSRFARSPILSGYYRLKEDKVTVVVQRQDNKFGTQGYKKTSKRRDEFQIKNHHKKKHIVLVWTHYSVFTKNKKGDGSTCNFDVITNRFPPLWFSRVKSFSAESDNPLI
ncbi:hypothetical protein NQ317_010094 [Molorchus minor]|uniref:F-box protein Hrt3/FBXO9 C-terminal domain-containing protein n=1 Tax=Molorchus minor TaxID=1323400 RepID=A0ABQ9JG12_9CUCU|nr:hypothetical protein NQ317_010094 [Molorchus minor]